MTMLLIAAAFVTAAILLRCTVLAAARRAVAWEDECRDRLRDRQWAAVAGEWTAEELRRT